MLRRNILIFHSAALGDFVVTWPLALALGRVFPQSRIIYVTAASKGALARKVLGIESIDAEAGWHGLFSEDGQLSDTAARWVQGAHTILTFIAQPGDTWTRNVHKLAPHAGIIHLWTNPVADGIDHVTLQLADQLRQVPIILSAYEQILRSVAERGISAHRPSTGGIVIHPGSGSPTKNWPLERYIAVAQELKDVHFILGEAELARLSSTEFSAIEKVARILRPATYVNLLEAVMNSKTFLGNDSGPSHIAGICGIRTVVLFGGDPPHRWKPLGPHVRIISKPLLSSVTVQDVLPDLMTSMHK